MRGRSTWPGGAGAAIVFAGKSPPPETGFVAWSKTLRIFYYVFSLEGKVATCMESLWMRRRTKFSTQVRVAY